MSGTTITLTVVVAAFPYCFGGDPAGPSASSFEGTQRVWQVEHCCETRGQLLFDRLPIALIVNGRRIHHRRHRLTAIRRRDGEPFALVERTPEEIDPVSLGETPGIVMRRVAGPHGDRTGGEAGGR